MVEDKEVQPEMTALILGVGNLLFKDEGVGVHLAQRSGSQTLPTGVQAIDCGTSLLNVVPQVAKAQKLIVVDAIKTGANAGTIFQMPYNGISESPRRLVSLHELSLLEVLEIVDRIARRPPTTIIGVEPKDVSMGMELSPEIECLLPRIAGLVLKAACR